MNEEDQLQFLKEILIDLCENNELQYDTIKDVKRHIIDTMSMVFDNINLELIELNFFKLINVNLNYKYNFNGITIYNKDDIYIILLIINFNFLSAFCLKESFLNFQAKKIYKKKSWLLFAVEGWTKILFLNLYI